MEPIERAKDLFDKYGLIIASKFCDEALSHITNKSKHNENSIQSIVLHNYLTDEYNYWLKTKEQLWLIS